jgi:xanthine dehydrogenase accessory factor
MLVLADGKTVGTLGGGCVEAEVRRRALELMSQGRTELMEFHLDHDYGWDDGLICGGVMEIYAQVVSTTTVSAFERIVADLRQHRPTALRITYERKGEASEYVEELGPPPRLIIAGAGHVGQALAKMAATLDFDVTVIDDRIDYVSAERFPTAKRRIIGPIEDELRKTPVDANTYVVVVTRGHRNDGHALAAVIDSPAKYIGLIGSRSKIKLIYDTLHGEGKSIDQLLRVHAPIGLEIGAVTVPEIAISIAAELVNVRRGREDQSTGSMKADERTMRAWLGRER